MVEDFISRKKRFQREKTCLQMQKGYKKIFKKVWNILFFYVVGPPKESIFLITINGLYFSYHYTYSITNYLSSWCRPSVGSFHVLHQHLSFWLVGTPFHDFRMFFIVFDHAKYTTNTLFAKFCLIFSFFSFLFQLFAQKLKQLVSISLWRAAIFIIPSKHFNS